MRKMTLYLLFILIPLFNNAGITTTDLDGVGNEDIYTVLKLADNGLVKTAYDLAIKGLKKLCAEGKLKNTSLLNIADYSQSNNNKRLYIIDLKNKKLLFNTYVAHGRNTTDEFARSFSNKEGSLKSSLGFYVTENPIVCSHTGYSLTINGVEKGINDHAVKRAIIIHGADYATEDFIRKYGHWGLSFGCPALPPDLSNPIIDCIKGGTCLFIYNPDNQYICSSPLLN